MDKVIWGYTIRDYQAEIKQAMEDAKREYKEARNAVHVFDLMESDLLHMLEENSLKASEQNRIASCLRKLRHDRREAKIKVAEYNRFNVVQDSSKVRLLISDGNTYSDDATYNPRVMSMEDLELSYEEVKQRALQGEKK